MSSTAGSGTPIESMKPARKIPRGPNAIRALAMVLSNVSFYQGRGTARRRTATLLCPGWEARRQAAARVAALDHIGEAFAEFVEPGVAQEKDYETEQPELPERTECGRVGLQENRAIAADQDVDGVLGEDGGGGGGQLVLGVTDGRGEEPESQDETHDL